MIKQFCDFCETELSEANMLGPLPGPTYIHDGSPTSLKNYRTIAHIEVATSLGGCYRKNEVCKYCLLDALYENDDRPRARMAQ